MEGVVVEVRVKAPCKRFAIKGKWHLRSLCTWFRRRQCKASPLFLPENNAGGDMHVGHLSMSSFWIADKPTEPLLSLPRSPFLVSGLPTTREFMVISAFDGTYSQRGLQ
jgi:hypothetical protein